MGDFNECIHHENTALQEELKNLKDKYAEKELDYDTLMGAYEILRSETERLKGFKEGVLAMQLFPK